MTASLHPAREEQKPRWQLSFSNWLPNSIQSVPVVLPSNDKTALSIENSVAQYPYPLSSHFSGTDTIRYSATRLDPEGDLDLNKHKDLPIGPSNLDTLLIARIFRIVGKAKAQLDNEESRERLDKGTIDAVQFASANCNLPPPLINIADDGELIMEWGNKKARIIVSFEGDSFISYAMSDGGAFVPGLCNSCKASGQLPADLANHLANLPEV